MTWHARAQSCASRLRLMEWWVAVMLLVCLTSLAAGQNADGAAAHPAPGGELDFLVGEWTGTSTLWFAPHTGRATVTEDGSMRCIPELDAMYIQCRVRFVRDDGREREMLIYYNHLPDDTAHAVLFLFNSWEGKVTYRLAADAQDATLLTGSFTERNEDGGSFTEYIDLKRSDDGRRLRGWERVQPAGAPEGSFEQTFEVFWERVR